MPQILLRAQEPLKAASSEQQARICQCRAGSWVMLGDWATAHQLAAPHLPDDTPAFLRPFPTNFYLRRKKVNLKDSLVEDTWAQTYQLCTAHPGSVKLFLGTTKEKGKAGKSAGKPSQESRIYVSHDDDKAVFTPTSKHAGRGKPNTLLTFRKDSTSWQWLTTFPLSCSSALRMSLPK